MDLFPLRECITLARYHPIDATPPTPEFEEDRCRVQFKLLFFKSLSRRFYAPPQIIPLRRFFSEGAEIARRVVVSSGWDEGGWTDDFVECFADMLSEHGLIVAADPRSSAEEGMILSYTLVLFVGMFPQRFVEWRDSEQAVRDSEETAAAAVWTFAAEEGAVRELKRVEIDQSDDEDEEEECCIICMEELSINGGKCLEMPCTHIFHTHCLLHWLELNHVCPLCRYALAIHNKYLS